MSNLIAPVARGLFQSFAPLREAVANPDVFTALLADLGWNVVVDEASLAALPVDELIGLFDQGDALVRQLINPVNLADLPDLVLELIALVQRVLELLEGLGSRPPSDVAVPLNDGAFWRLFVEDLPSYLLRSYLARHQPLLDAVLRLVGVIEVEALPTDAAVALDHPSRVIAVTERLDWSVLGAWVTDPAGHLQKRFGWGGAFDARALVETIANAALLLMPRVRTAPIAAAYIGSGKPWAASNPHLAGLHMVDLPLLRGFLPDARTFANLGLRLVPIPKTPAGEAAGLLVTELATGALQGGVAIFPDWTLSITGGFDGTGIVGVKVFPDAVGWYGTAPHAEATIALQGQPGEPWYLLGDSTGGYLRVHGLLVAIKFIQDQDGVAVEAELATVPGAHGEPGIEVAVLPSQGDGFVHDLLGDVSLTGGCDLGVVWSSRDGFLLQGGPSLVVTIPVAKSIGPVFLQSVTVGMDATDGAAFEASVSASVTLGPFVLVFDRVGLKLAIDTSGGDDAAIQFGGLGLDLAFKPPSGVGLSCDAGCVSGGGYVYIDPSIGQYAGVVDLQILAVGLTAMGIISTQLPDGSDGWAMILSISSQFPPIQLGFGFTLNGVGGLVAVNRTLSASVLQEGLKDGSLDALLFPENPVAEAVRLLALLDTAFPIAEGQFTFGPIAEIGWGAPSLFTAQVGVIISLPDPLTIVVIGQFAAILPEPDRVLVEIHLDVLGVLDFAAGTVAVDAVLRDSFIVGLVLAGAMAFRSSFLAAPSFLLSCGGFHPDFQPPDNVPDLARLSVALDLGDELQVSLETYLAITSNTFQTGARLYAIAQAGKFTAEGDVGFNTLIYFSPFHFVADVGFAVEVRLGDMTLLGVDLALTFTGPEPWHAAGTATFTFLGADIDFRVEGTLGGRPGTETIDAVNVGDRLVDTLRLAEAWAAPVPDVTEVTLRDTATAGDTWAHPDGFIEVRQHLVPLAEVLASYGNAPILGDDRFEITDATIGTITATDTTDLTDWFAPAQFFTQTTTERLASPSFELLKCGVAFGGGTARSGPEVASTLDYDCFYVDPEADAEASKFVRELEAAELVTAVSTSLAAQAAARRPTARSRVPARVTVAPTRWVVARTDTLSVATSILAAPSTRTDAQAALDTWLGSRPQEAFTYQIIPEAEAL